MARAGIRSPSKKKAAPEVEVGKTLLKAENISKTYFQGGGVDDLTVLHETSLEIRQGEIIALVGPSGSGKSTLLHIMGLLDTPTAGRVVIGGRDTKELTDDERTRLRRFAMGFVYQFHYLQPEFSALENVMIPQMILGEKRDVAIEKAKTLLGSMGLTPRLEHRPARLSGGEQQRVAIARALANDPKILLADEPTGNLDPQTSDDVFAMLLAKTREAGIGALIATHNMELASRMDRILVIENGVVKEKS
ncbi:MAG: ABC transporter ATP-binding protein [Pseudobdellovibrionaceae bacterium]